MKEMRIRSTAEREQAGKSLRQRCPRLSHGNVVLGQGKKRDIVALLEASNKDRLKNLVWFVKTSSERSRRIGSLRS